MAVAFDAYSQSSDSTTDPITWTHTPVGTPKGVIVFVRCEGDASDVVVGATYGGVAMTEVAGSPNLRGTALEGRAVHCFFLGSSIPTGDQTVSIDRSASGTLAIGSAITLTAAADTEIQDSDGTIDTNSQSNPSVTLSLAGKSSFCAIAFSSGIADPSVITPLTNWTSRAEADHGFEVSAVYTYNTIGTTDVTAGWTQTAEDAVAIAVAVTETAGGVDTSESRSGTSTAAATGTGRISVQDEKRSTVSATATVTGRKAVQDAKRSTVTGQATVTGVSDFRNATWEKAGTSSATATVSGRISVLIEIRSSVSALAQITGRSAVQDAKRSTITGTASVTGASDFTDESGAAPATIQRDSPFIANVGSMMIR